MSRSFYEYVEHRIVENTDYNAISERLNQLILEKGYVTAEDLQEAWFGIPQMARGVAALGGGLGRIAGDLGGRAAGAVGSGLQKAGSAVGGAASKLGQSAMNKAGQAYGAAKSGLNQAGSTIASGAQQAGEYVGKHMDAAKNAQAKKQVLDRKNDLAANPLFKKLDAPTQKYLLMALDKMANAAG